MNRELILSDETATIAFGKCLGECIGDLDASCIVYLEGTLGAGKTTFCRGVLSAFGHSGPVKSPTYTLVEPYDFPERIVYHFDLYRLGDPEELEFLGIRDYFAKQAVALIEWPDKGKGIIPSYDVLIDLKPVEEGRKLLIKAGTERGVEVLSSLKQ